MTTYNLPKEPSGPVWDKEGNKWEKRDRYWETGTIAQVWSTLLEHYGPLSDFPPVKVGDTITLEEFSKLPRHSIAGTDINAYVVHSHGIRATYSRDILDLNAVCNREVTLLRIGVAIWQHHCLDCKEEPKA